MRSHLGFRRWLWPALWGAAILTATSVPGDSLPNAVFASADKLVHLAMYGVLGALLARAAAAPPNRAWPATRLLAIALAFGAADELHQQFVPGRSAELLDWGADATGAALGIFLTTLALRRRELET